MPELISFARKRRGDALILIPAGDAYVEFLDSNRESLSKYYKFLIPNGLLIKKLTDKAELYKTLSEYGIDFPDFEVLTPGDNYLKKLSRQEYPAVLKPANSAEYWRHPFPGMRKVYFPKTRDEAGSAVAALRYYGYTSGIILQKFVKNCEPYVYTALYNEKGGRDFGVFGRVVLEERGETSSGNYAAIITEECPEITHKLDRLLIALGYFGFANFDILKSGNKFYVLELNARQGRSCDYIRCAGINIAKRLLFCLGLDELSEEKPRYKKILWHYPPFRVCMKYMRGQDKREAKRLKRRRLSFAALGYKKDVAFNPGRASYVFIHKRRLSQKLKREYAKENFA